MTKNKKSLRWSFVVFLTSFTLFMVFGLEALDREYSFTNGAIFVSTGCVMTLSFIYMLFEIDSRHEVKPIEKKEFVCPCSGNHYNVTIITGKKLADYDASLCKACIRDQLEQGNFAVFK